MVVTHSFLDLFAIKVYFDKLRLSERLTCVRSLEEAIATMVDVQVSSHGAQGYSMIIFDADPYFH